MAQLLVAQMAVLGSWDMKLLKVQQMAYTSAAQKAIKIAMVRTLPIGMISSVIKHPLQKLIAAFRKQLDGNVPPNAQMVIALSRIRMDAKSRCESTRFSIHSQTNGTPLHLRANS